MVVSEAVMEQQRIADLQQQLHHAESCALAAVTRAAQMDARQSEARAIYLKNSGKRASFDGQASGFRSFRFTRRIAAPWMLT